MPKIVSVNVLPDPKGKGNDTYQAIYDDGRKLEVPRYSSVKKYVLTPALQHYQKTSQANPLTQEEIYNLIQGTKMQGADAVANAIYSAIFCGTPEDRSRDAMNIGSHIHKLIEDYLSGHDVGKVEEPFTYAWEQFLLFANAHKIEVMPEGLECPLVSEKYLFGGRVDMIAYVDGILSIVDWKTSKDIYSDYAAQISCYAQLWNENNPEKPVKQGICVRVPKTEWTEYTNKKTGKVTRIHHKLLTLEMNEYQLEWVFSNMFKSELNIYNYMESTTTLKKTKEFLDAVYKEHLSKIN